MRECHSHDYTTVYKIPSYLTLVGERPCGLEEESCCGVTIHREDMQQGIAGDLQPGAGKKVIIFRKITKDLASLLVPVLHTMRRNSPDLKSEDLKICSWLCRLLL